MIHPEYVLFAGLGLALALLFPVTRHLRKREDRRNYYTLQMITLVGAVVGAKLSVLLGDYGWPFFPISDWEAVLLSGRSVTGALILGFAAAEAAKPILGYTLPPNDRFATLLCFSLATGRLGCLAAGCCRGIEWNGPLAIHGRHPIPVYEILFLAATGFTFLFLLRKGLLFGRLFSVYLIAYGVFRFLSEPLRETPKLFGSFSGYQLLCMVMIFLGAAFLLKRTLRPPAAWKELAAA